MPTARAMAGSDGRLRAVVVTNIPAPYRIPVYGLLAQHPEIDFHAVYCSGREPDREWDLGQSSFAHTFLDERMLTYRGRFIHINHDVWGVLDGLRPEVVVTTGFNPTHLIAYVWARMHGVRHVAMTDGTLESEATLSSFHRWIRRLVYANTAAYIGASEGGMRLYRAYGIDSAAMFRSPLCADNERFFATPAVPKTFDFIFCGRFAKIKNPLFALEVARDTALRLGRRVSIVFVGSGGMEREMRDFAKTLEAHVDASFAGFARQEDLPRWYAAARLLLFPTQWDPWGVVANEACAAGVPVLVSSSAGSANDLVCDGENGYVLPLRRDVWTDAAVRLLQDSDLYAAMSRRCRELVREYNYANSTCGIAEAMVMAAGRKTRPRVVIVQRRLTHYRVPLFERLRAKLKSNGVDLQVIFGDATSAEKLKDDSGLMEWGTYVPCHYFADGRLCWQDISPFIRDADLVIVTQENRLLYNYRLLFGRTGYKVAYWGHGANLQARHRRSILERWKALTSTRVDWWFAYTRSCAQRVAGRGFANERITTLDNAIDTRTLRAELDSVSDEEVRLLRQQLDLGEGPVGVFIGSFYADKRIDFLLEAGRRVAAAIPGFRLIVIGDGPLRGDIEAACHHHDWLRLVGRGQGRAKASYLRLGTICLNPGLVGLSILDAFVAGLVLVTTDCGIHSPEIDYLENGVNGVMTENSMEAYTDAIVGLLRDEERLYQLRGQALLSAERYSIENMADNFCNGILAALSR